MEESDRQDPPGSSTDADKSSIEAASPPASPIEAASPPASPIQGSSPIQYSPSSPIEDSDEDQLSPGNGNGQVVSPENTADDFPGCELVVEVVPFGNYQEALAWAENGGREGEVGPSAGNASAPVLDSPEQYVLVKSFQVVTGVTQQQAIAELKRAKWIYEVAITNYYGEEPDLYEIPITKVEEEASSTNSKGQRNQCPSSKRQKLDDRNKQMPGCESGMIKDDHSGESSNITKVVPFSGVGYRLGSPVPSQSIDYDAVVNDIVHETVKEIVNATEDVDATELVIDCEQPTTEIQIRLIDGSRMTQIFNTSHTVRDIMCSIVLLHPQYANIAFNIMTGFPPRVLANLDNTIDDEKIHHSLLVMKKKH